MTKAKSVPHTAIDAMAAFADAAAGAVRSYVKANFGRDDISDDEMEGLWGALKPKNDEAMGLIRPILDRLIAGRVDPYSPEGVAGFQEMLDIIAKCAREGCEAYFKRAN